MEMECSQGEYGRAGEGEEGSAGPQPLDAVAGADSQKACMAQRVRVFSLLFHTESD